MSKPEPEVGKTLAVENCVYELTWDDKKSWIAVNRWSAGVQTGFQDDSPDKEGLTLIAQRLAAADNMIQSAATELGCDPLALAEGLADGGLAMVYKALKSAEGHDEEILHDRKWHPIGKCPVLDYIRGALALFPETKP